MNTTVTLAGLLVGFVVGLTGMGGGALMTPILVLLFHVTPLTAVSSDLVASAVMKPVAGFVHARRGTVQWRLVGWLALGSTPSAFAGVLVLRALGHGRQIQAVVSYALGAALVLAAAGVVLRAWLRRSAVDAPDPAPPVRVRPVATLLIGAFGGLLVGMTSVGSGSLMIVALLLLYPGLTAHRLVGTDLVQAIPLVAAAAVGHLLFGDFRLSLTVSLLAGSIPGAWLGSRLSSRAPQRVIQRAIVVVLALSGAKLLGAGTVTLGVSFFALLLAVLVLTPRREAPPAAA